MIELFITETCPYCKKVVNYMQENNIDYEKKDVSNSEHRKTLIDLGGKDQVPFLHDPDNNVRMYESNDIIKYVSELEE